VRVAGGPVNATLFLDNVSANNNPYGIYADQSTIVSMTRSVLTKNATGVQIGPAPAAVKSFGDNDVDGNGADVAGASALVAVSPR